MKFNLSLGQMDIVLGRPERNLETVRAMTAEAARRGSELVIFPELWSTGYDLANAAAYATPIDQGIFAETAALARQYGLHILGSCLSLLGPGRYGNTAVLFTPDGRPSGSYRKVHLFGPMDEDRYLTPGQSLPTIETPWGTAGLAICYDLRFPEIFRSYALSGARFVFLPAEWPYPRLAHWRTLLRARAIENQLFVVACNRVGQSPDYTFFGHSTVVDPAGELVVEGGEEPMLLTVELDLSLVESVRDHMTIFADRRPDVYGG